ncbi:MAG TPA: HD domain-containing protein [Sulfurovum sp.]|nr:HD domain-containing protein [Sulfurovum sp.]
MNSIYSYNFWKSLLFRQNDHHRYGVFRHTVMVAYHLLREKQYKLILASLMHDFGKPLTAKPDNDDIARGNGELSFRNHEAISYLVIKNWRFVSDYSKEIVRHHYLIRGMGKAKKKNEMPKYRRLKRTWDGLSDEMKKDLAVFLKADDLAKK